MGPLGFAPFQHSLNFSWQVSKVTLVVMSGDRGLCGGYNSYGIKKTEARIKELQAQGIEVGIPPCGIDGFWRAQSVLSAL